MLRSSGIEILLVGSHSKIFRRMQPRSSLRGRMDLRKVGFCKNASKEESSGDACFHGLRLQVKLIKMTPKDQTSFGPVAYDENGLGDGGWHSEERVRVFQADRRSTSIPGDI